MPRRLSIVALFAAWFCASGAMLDGVQVFAWTRMFTQYARAMPLEQAAAETMDPAKPCPICLAIRRARNEAKHEQPAAWSTAAAKVVLVYHETPAIVLNHETPAWPDAIIARPADWSPAVPVPPPRHAGVSAT